jgi:hypothetical protein
MHAKTIGAHPFKRFLLPFDSYPEFREQQALAGVFSDCVVGSADPRKTSITVEPVRVGDERPQSLRGRPEPPFPLVMKLWVAHPDLLLYPNCTVYRQHNARLSPFGQGGGELAVEGRLSATTEEAWVDYDTLYFMQQIDAVAQQSEE